MTYETFRIINFVWIGMALITFFIVLKINPPYGRHTNAGWGILINNRLAWFLMEVPVLLIASFFIFIGNENLTTPVVIMGGLFCLHYIHRSLIFPLRIHTPGKQMPVVIMCSAVLFNLVNGTLIGYYFRNFAHYEAAWIYDPRFISGLVIFITGTVLNVTADTTLIRLRKPGETGYKIPTGLLFNLVSCPNHLGEMLEWLGFAMMCWNLPALSFFIWTVANVLPRALAHHTWYRLKFPDYPEKRKAVIPYLI